MRLWSGSPLSSTEDSSSEEEGPAADPSGPAAAVAIAVAVRARASVTNATAGDISENRESVCNKQTFD